MADQHRRTDLAGQHDVPVGGSGHDGVPWAEVGDLAVGQDQEQVAL